MPGVRVVVGGVLLMGLWGARRPPEAVRPPAVAGQFYPGDPERLTAAVDQLLAQAPAPAVEGELVALLVPHAGYDYSGGVAAAAFQLLRDRPVDTVILVGAAHRYPVEGAALYPGTALATPLGHVAIRAPAAQWLAQQSPLVTINAEAHEGEHSLEVELPFLQRLMPQAQIVPLVMGDADLEVCQAIGQLLARLVERERQSGRSCLLLVSSDLSHYPTEQDAHQVDRRSLAAMASGDPAAVHRASAGIMQEGVAQLFCTFCGEGAVKTVMAAARQVGANHVTEIRYATSADVPQGEPDRVVGYAAVAFSRSHGEEQRLLQLARQAIARYLTQQQRPPTAADPTWPAALHEPAAVFVTLRRGDRLRGCIGTTEPRERLGLAVQHYAIAAATEDTRFLPVTSDELAELNLEISVLSPLRRVASAAEIQPRVHGVVITRDNRSGLFLPQVWDDTAWSREEFLSQLCSQKAGLPPNAWQDPATELYVFTVTSFAE